MSVCVCLHVDEHMNTVHFEARRGLLIPWSCLMRMVGTQLRSSAWAALAALTAKPSLQTHKIVFNRNDY